MKIFLLDEVFEFAKRIGITSKINELAKKMYNPASIQSELQSYYDIINSEEYSKIMQELEARLKEEDLSLYNLQVYTKTQSYDVVSALLNNVKNIRDRFVLIDKAIAYKMGSAYEYEILISLFCSMYDEVSEDIKQRLPKYIHIAYFNYNSIRFCLTRISTSGGLDPFDEYEKYMDGVYKKINSYIKSTDTLDNLRLEVRCAALQYIMPRLTNEKKVETLTKLEKLADISKMTFDNRYNSIGVIWTFERLYESYLDLGMYPKFFEWVYKQYMYIDNALSNKEVLFDALRYYNKNNITGFIISMKRFYKLQNLYPIFNMEFQNIAQSDEDFITNPDLDYTLYDDYSNKLVMEKFKNYVDAWYENNKNKLEDLAGNKDVLHKCKRIVIDGISEEEVNNMDGNNQTPSYEDSDHPENESTVDGGTFGEEEKTPEAPTTPNIELPDLPPGFDFDLSDLENLSNLAGKVVDYTPKTPEELMELERETDLTEEEIANIPPLPPNLEMPTITSPGGTNTSIPELNVNEELLENEIVDDEVSVIPTPPTIPTFDDKLEISTVPEAETPEVNTEEESATGEEPISDPEMQVPPIPDLPSDEVINESKEESVDEELISVPDIPIPPIPELPSDESEEVPSTEETVSIPELPTNIPIPPLPGNFEVNEDELSSLTEEELAAMREMENE